MVLTQGLKALDCTRITGLVDLGQPMLGLLDAVEIDQERSQLD